jgi:Glycosyl transferases group 1
MKWICSQIGAREHYAIPRVLTRKGDLKSFFTDLWFPPKNILRTLSSSFSGRFHPELSLEKVRSNNLKGLWWEFKRRKMQDPYIGFLQYGRWFSEETRNLICKFSEIDKETIFFSYDTGFLETAEYVKSKGGMCVVCQIDPGVTEQLIVKEECVLWPGWANDVCVPSEYNARRSLEWELADKVMVNSEWSKKALITQGVPEQKLVVIPLCYEPGLSISIKQNMYCGNSNRPLKVLWLGNVNLRKGIQYLIEAAHLLVNENIIFNIVGPLEITNKGLQSAPKNMNFHGRCMRNDAKQWYVESDLFVLPTLSDGFAITQLEAMAYGLPVITTSCCGKVVSDGEDGFFVPKRNSEALANKILTISQDRYQLKSLSRGASTKAQLYNMNYLSRNIKKLESLLV